MATQTPTFMLTPRELDVLKLVVQGLSNPDIADRLVAGEHIAPVPWPTWCASSASRAAAVAWAVRTGLVWAWLDRASAAAG